MVRVITYGTFDLFHEGHYRLLERAKALGDYLIVGVTTDAYDKTRGKLNVIDPLPARIENVKKTGFADEVIIEEAAGQKFNDIKKFHIDIFTVGSDWVGCFDYLKDYCQVIYLERTKNISSTMLREQNSPIQRVGIIGTGRILIVLYRKQNWSAELRPRAFIIPIKRVQKGLRANGRLMDTRIWRNFMSLLTALILRHLMKLITAI